MIVQTEIVFMKLFYSLLTNDYIKLYNSFVIGLQIKTIIYKCFYNLHQFTVAFHSHLCNILI